MLDVNNTEHILISMHSTSKKNNTWGDFTHDQKTIDIYLLTIFTYTVESLKSTFAPLPNLHICRIIMNAS